MSALVFAYLRAKIKRNLASWLSKILKFLPAALKIGRNLLTCTSKILKIFACDAENWKKSVDLHF